MSLSSINPVKRNFLLLLLLYFLHEPVSPAHARAISGNVGPTSSKYLHKFSDMQENRDFNEFIINMEEQVHVLKDELKQSQQKGGPRNISGQEQEKVRNIIQKMEFDLKEVKLDPDPDDWRSIKGRLEVQLDLAQQFLGIPKKERRKIELKGAGIIYKTDGGSEINLKPRTDKEITATVKQLLQSDGMIDAEKIDVRTVAGVVALRGEVDSVLGRSRAVELVSMINGVKDIREELQVQIGKPRDPLQLKQDIESLLSSDPATNAFQIVTTVEKNGIVSLTGSVESWPEKHKAEQLAQSIRGVRDVRNLLTIRHKEKRTDGEIATDIRNALKWNALVDEKQIQVLVKNGKVKLHGFVESLAARNRAIQESSIQGVDSVDTSELEVQNGMDKKGESGPNHSSKARPSSPPKDQAIQDAFEKARAHEVASGIIGVLLINNDLVVQKGEGVKETRKGGKQPRKE